jgi:predicted lipid-binding transport protein (Tim44 family)
MSDQEKKLNDAEYFYGELVDKFNNEQFEKFNYNLSAFLTATRSILQYTYESSKDKGKLNDYNKLISKNRIIGFFKEKRDINIHEVPVNSVQQINMDICATITISTSSIITVLDSNGKVIEEKKSSNPGVSKHNNVETIPPKKH